MKAKKLKELLIIRINLEDTERRFYLVFFIVTFAFLFLNFFEPFGLYYDKTISSEEVFIELSIAMLTAFVILLFSQFAIREIFKIKKFTVLTLFLWFLFESFLVACTWTLLEVIENNSLDSVFDIWVTNFVAFIIIMFLPYVLYSGYITIKDRFKQIESEKETLTKEKNSKYEFSLKDESNKTQLVVSTDNLFYIQAADNYLEIFYLKNEVPTKLLIRNSIKKIEEVFLNSPVIRCHRSFIVNTSKIELAKRISSGYKLRLFQFSDTEVPVSKSFISELGKHLK